MLFKKYCILNTVLIVLIVFAIFNAPANAAHVATLSLKRLVNASEVILIGKVISIKKHLFGKRSLEISITELIKGKVTRHNKIKIKYKSTALQLIQDHFYVFFLDEGNGWYQLVGGIQGYSKIYGDNYFFFDDQKINLNEFKNRIKHFMIGN